MRASRLLPPASLAIALSMLAHVNVLAATPATSATPAASAASATVPATQREPHAPPWSDTAAERPFDDASLDALAGLLDRAALTRLSAFGEHLFTHRFTADEGGTRPLATQAILPTRRRRVPRSEFARTAGMDANACASCHNAPRPGGAGDFSVNVFVSEGFRQADFDTIDPQFSNERNTNHLFGAGLVELLAREMSAELQALRSAGLRTARTDGIERAVILSSKGVDFGTLLAYPDGLVDTRKIDGVDADLVIRPFSQKGVMTSLRQFTVNALNHHHGLQADERFGARWTDEPDFDGDGRAHEIGARGVSALVAWQATLPPPGRAVPAVAQDGRLLDAATRTAWSEAAARGEQHFSEFGCAGCHRPSLPLQSLVFDDPGPLDAAGTLRLGEDTGLQYDLAQIEAIASLPRDANGQVLVPLFGDLKRHAISDRQVATLGNELLSQRFVERNVFQTAELWGIAASGPYGHRGDLGTLGEVIEAHGAAARGARDAWLGATQTRRDDVLAFLKTLSLMP